MADFASPARLWAARDALCVRGASVSLLTDGARLSVEPAGGHVAGADGGAGRPVDADVLELRADAATTAVLRLAVPLGDAAGYWHPGAGWDRHLVADWANPWRTVGLVDSAPLGCLYDTAGRALLAFASDRIAATTRVRFGVGEESARFGVWLSMDLAAGETCRIRVQAPGRPWAEAVREVTGGLADAAPLPVPDAARAPAYSTWYSMHRELTAAGVEAEAVLAAEMGCGVLLLDDGWQLHADGPGYSGSGAWTPDPAKFPDFAAHVRTVQGLDLRYVAWIAPLLVGERTPAYEELARVAPHEVTRLGCRVLDPRRPAARRFAVDSCVDLVQRYGLDGLKIDFLDFAMAYAAEEYAAEELAGGDHAAEVHAVEVHAVEVHKVEVHGADRPTAEENAADENVRTGRDDGTGAGRGASTDAGTGVATAAGPDTGGGTGTGTGTGKDTCRGVTAEAPADLAVADVADVGLGIRLLLTELRERLRELRGDELLIELRQPYTGPGMRRFGNMLRAADCPGDATANRVRTLDTGVLAGSAAVHSDMLMWDPAAPAEAASRQLHSALFSAPQISVALAGQSAEHRAMTAFWLGVRRTYADVLDRGEIRAGRPDQLHQTVTAALGRRAVIACYAEHHVVPLQLAEFTEVALVNSTAGPRVVLDVGDPGVERPGVAGVAGMAGVAGGSGLDIDAPGVAGTGVRVRLDVFDACGRPAASGPRTLGPGLTPIAVPPSGLCVIRPVAPEQSPR
ncbi:alpha-galactosidase [Streptomyces sp. NPDC008317]|uniref:alpha-galactosidase n=1 Tax=Streptomyces sp. NPDC008317 TaxID=3364827 RepID=UPI0036E21C32